MAQWLQSGRRRDVCALLYDADSLTGQQLKSRLEAHYDTHLNPRSFYGGLDALVETGYVETRVAGIHDEYALTPAGAEAVEAHYAWLSDRIA
ncbi:MAG: PadR family transcriptional regulator [Halobacteriota archaeon]